MKINHIKPLKFEPTKNSKPVYIFMEYYSKDYRDINKNYPKHHEETDEDKKYIGNKLNIII